MPATLEAPAQSAPPPASPEAGLRLLLACSAPRRAPGLASIAELSSVLSMDRTTLSRNLKPLVAENLVSFDEDGGGRAKAVRITRAGQARLKDALPLWRKAQRALGQQAGEERLAELHGRLLDLIRSY